MTIDLPVSYDKTDINSEGGILFGVPIQTEGLRTLANNHNFIGAKYAPHFGSFLDSGGAYTTEATGSGNWHNIAGVSSQKQVDGRGITCKFEASNASTETQYIRINAGGTASAYATIPAGSGFTSYTVTITTSPTSSDVYPVVLQGQTGSALGVGETMSKIRNAVFYWTPQSGNVGDGPTTSGFIKAKPSDHFDTEPLTVEQFNRFRGGPRVVFESMPTVVGSFTSQMYQPDNTNKTTRTLMGHVPIVKRRNDLNVRFDVISMGSACEIFVPAASGVSGTYYSVTPSVSTSATIYETDPASIGVNSSSTVDLSSHPLITVCQIYMTSPDTSTQARVFSVQAVMV
mgnify:CR=1 FL=1